MHHPASVRVRQGIGDVLQQPNALPRGEGASARDALCNTLAFHITHDERQHAVAILDGVHGHDVGVRKTGCDARLAHEAFAQHCVSGEFAGQDFDGDVAIEL